MLIITSKSPRFGTQKPAQWGPLSAVQYAVRVNAERLGIDPASIAVLYPFFDDVALLGWQTSSMVGALVVSDGGVVCSGTNYITNSKRIASSSAHSVISIFTPITLSAVFTFGQYQKTGGTGYEYGVYSADRYYTKNGTYVTIPALSVGVSRVLIDICDGVNSKIFSNGSFAGTGGALLTSLYDYQICGLRNSVAQNSAVHNLHVIFDSAISEGLVPVFSVTPYALIMPVSRPFYLDLGGGGNTFITLDKGSLELSGKLAAVDRQLALDSVGLTLTGLDLTQALQVVLSKGTLSLVSKDVAIDKKLPLTVGSLLFTGLPLDAITTEAILLGAAELTLTGKLLGTTIHIPLTKGMLVFRNNRLYVNGKLLGAILKQMFNLNFNLWG